MDPSTDGRLHPAWWALIMVSVLASLLFIALSLFDRRFTPYARVTVTSDRAGLVMESGGKVKMRGVQVGRVSAIDGTTDAVRLELDIDPDQLKYIPANVDAEIRSTTAFGSKYVDLVYPNDPARQRLSAGAVVKSRNVTTEVNTVFQNLLGLMDKIDPAKLNSILTAFGDGLRGQGPAIGETISDANHVLLELNPRAETIHRDWRALRAFSDTYSAAAQDILEVLSAASTTGATIAGSASALDALLLNVTGFSHGGINLLAPSKDNLVRAVNDLEPTTALLLKYNPSLTCSIVGGHMLITDYGMDAVTGGNGRAGIASGSFSFGDDPYKYPENLPIIGARGGPGGKPGCGSLPDVSKNFPARALVTNTGWGRGLDYRPNPGIGFPGWANYFPVTRAVPEPPSIRYQGGPAPGPPPPYPGGPPYGAPWYEPDGTPLFAGLPPGVPSQSRPPDPAEPPPGAERFVPPLPAQMQPTPVAQP